MRIHVLPTHVANQIAAGEVIERPASVVKELLENAIDAGAKRIHIDIEKGGSTLIRVRDDGDGIALDDLPLAIASHATSKLHTLDDLNYLASLGFRGEALASISSVSQFHITSKARDTDAAHRLSMNGRYDEVKISPAAHPQGTTIEVSNLFFNTPARAKFLRTHKTEFAHISDVVKHIALSHFDVALTLTHDQSIELQLPAARGFDQQQKRVAKILGKNFLAQCNVIDRDHSGLRLWGWQANASYSRSSSDFQFFYINGRMVRDRLIQRALRQAHESLIDSGRFSAYVLHLHLDPAAVDINVHPTKHEVRFENPRMIHDFIVQALSQALREQEQTIAVHCADAEISYHVAPGSIATSSPSIAAIIGQCHDKFLLLENDNGIDVIEIKKLQQQIFLNDIKANLLSAPMLIPQRVNLSSAQFRQFELHHERFISIGFELQVMGPNWLMVRSIPKGFCCVQFEKCVIDLLDAIARASDSLFEVMSAHHQPPHPQSDMQLRQLAYQFHQLPSAIKQTLRQHVALAGVESA